MEINNPIDVIILSLNFVIQWWWIILPPALFTAFWELWTDYVRSGYLAKMSWTMMEINMPKEVFQTPKAIEGIFSALHSMSSPPDNIEKYWKGKIQDYLSLEIVGDAGKSHFYIRIPSALKGYASSQIYAQYPKAEIKEVPDYVTNVPLDIPNAQYELWGTEIILAKEDGYPIRTYVDFEETIEEKRLDPLASLMESFAQLKDGEQIWVQILAKPHSAGWEKDGQELINGLLGKKTAPKKTLPEKILGQIFDLIEMAIGGGQAPEKKEPTKISDLTPGKKEVIEAIEKNISKLGFDTTIRTLYIGKREIYNRANIAAILGFFKQFNTLNLNGFKPNSDVSPKVKYPFFRSQREFTRKRSVYMNYRFRAPGKKNFVFNTEELATIFHFPGTVVEASATPRIEAKKAEPPSNLPI